MSIYLCVCKNIYTHILKQNIHVHIQTHTYTHSYSYSFNFNILFLFWYLNIGTKSFSFTIIISVFYKCIQHRVGICWSLLTRKLLYNLIILVNYLINWSLHGIDFWRMGFWRNTLVALTYTIWNQGDEAGRSLHQCCLYKLLRVWRKGETVKDRNILESNCRGRVSRL